MHFNNVHLGCSIMFIWEDDPAEDDQAAHVLLHHERMRRLYSVERNENVVS